METTDFLESIRQGLKDEILRELMPEIDRLLHANIFTFQEAMQFLKVSEATLRRMVRDQQIPHFYLRGILHFRQIDLDQHISKKLIRKGSSA